jgi:hypothetical protein
MAQTAAHLADHAVPPVPVRQWVISVPKRLRGMLANRSRAVATLTKIFLTEIERLLLAASGGAPDAETPRAFRPRLGGISFLRRFGSAINHHVHLHGCVTDGVFVPAAAASAGDGHGSEGCCNAKQQPRFHDTSRIAWAKLMARVGEEFPLECPACGGDIRLIAFITEPGPIRKILTHFGEPLEPPPVSPARGPPTDWGELMQVHDVSRNPLRTPEPLLPRLTSRSSARRPLRRCH